MAVSDDKEFEAMYLETNEVMSRMELAVVGESTYIVLCASVKMLACAIRQYALKQGMDSEQILAATVGALSRATRDAVMNPTRMQ